MTYEEYVTIALQLADLRNKYAAMRREIESLQSALEHELCRMLLPEDK